MKKIITLAFIFGLSGCSDTIPEPNATTCAPGAYEEALAEIRSKSQRLAFTEECKNLQRAEDMRKNAEAARIAAELDAEARGDAMEEKMRKWNFKRSSPDRY